MQIKQFPNKNVRDGTDKLLIQSSEDICYHMTVNDFLSNFSSSGGASWQAISDSQSLEINSKSVITATVPITLTLPTSVLGEIEIYNNSNVKTSIVIAQYKGATITAPMQLSKFGTYTRLIWLNSTIGWFPLFGELEAASEYPPGMSLHLEGGILLDKSGNNNHATPLNSVSPPLKVTGLDNKEVLRWNGASNQELQVTPFLGGTTSATLYIVFSLNSNIQYNLVKTANIDDYWRFNRDGNGYFGTFLNNRQEGYPSGMPVSGNHLISIHVNSNSYEVLINNVSRQIQPISYFSGDRFRIGCNDKPFNGDIALLLVYPTFIDKTSANHTAIVNTIRASYPSLPSY